MFLRKQNGIHYFTGTNLAYFMKHTIAHRGSILWNALSASCNGGSLQSVQTFCKMAKKDDTLLRMDFKALSVQSIPNFMPDFILS